MSTSRQSQKNIRLKEFVQTNKQFVLMRGETIQTQEESLLEILKAMPLDERIQFYFDNFESIFVSIFPEDVGYFIFVPSTQDEWDILEENLTRIGAAK